MSNREIKTSDIASAVSNLCVKANTVLRTDVKETLKKFYEEENASLSKKMLSVLLENSRIAEKETMSICQDTGMVSVFIEIGENVTVTGGIIDAVNKGVEDAYEKCCFRKSVVKDPLMRENTGTNTPAIIHTDIVKGDKLAISVMPKGFGSENKSRSAMLSPTRTPPASPRISTNDSFSLLAAQAISKLRVALDPNRTKPVE